MTKGFECPACGSTHFGTSDAHTDTPTYHCHDQFHVGCHWRGSYDFPVDNADIRYVLHRHVQGDKLFMSVHETAEGAVEAAETHATTDKLTWQKFPLWWHGTSRTGTRYTIQKVEVQP
jgi:hypothetical protein